MRTDLTIQDAVNNFERIITGSRSPNTALTYSKGLRIFVSVLESHGLDVKTAMAAEINEEMLPWFLDELKNYAPASEQLYATAVTRFYNYMAAEDICELNLARIKEITRMRTRRMGQRLPQFPRESIEKILDFMIALIPAGEDDERLITLRDRAFIVTLADTGMRVHEACNLRRGDVDWNEGRAIIVGKGNKQAVVRFSQRSLALLKDYLRERSALDGSSGRGLSALPVFARHDKGAGKKIKPMTPTTGRNIVEERIFAALGEEARGTITPHSFRHYFVTTVLRASGNMKLAQELARHASISVTQRYAHLSDDELDKGYYEIFDQKE